MTAMSIDEVIAWVGTQDACWLGIILVALALGWFAPAALDEWWVDRDLLRRSREDRADRHAARRDGT